MDPTVQRFSKDSAIEQADTLVADEIAAVAGRLGRAVLGRPVLGRPVIIGLCGPQGSGKSTTVGRLVTRLEAKGLRTVARSLDDFYLTKAERHRLAANVHPLLITRGVPGTHDLALLHQTLDQLSSLAGTHSIALPTFDKTTDDRAPKNDWPVFQGRADVIILEGWCVGARAQPEPDLAVPINALEATEDPHGIWRTFVNNQLIDGYAALFARLDLKVMLKAPTFEYVFDWRAEQEAKLDRSADGSRPPMSGQELRRFIAHYERITCWLMTDEPADLVIQIDHDRTPLFWRRR